MAEHYFPSSDYNAKYCCLLMNLITEEIVDVLLDRKKTYLSNHLSSIKYNTFEYTTKTIELDNVKFISIDMYENFRDITRTYFPKAKICADSFHVLKHLTDNFRKARISCQNSTDNPVQKSLLIRFKNVFEHSYQEHLYNDPRYNKSLCQYIKST